MSNVDSNPSMLPEPVDAADSNQPLITNEVVESTQTTVDVPKPEDFDDEKGKMNTIEVFPFLFSEL